MLRFLLVISLVVPLVIAVAVAGLFIYEPTPAEGFDFSSEGETMQLSDGRTLAYMDLGDRAGRPVFYFHGAPGSRLEGLVFEELNKQMQIRMIALDRPGYGLSDFQDGRTYLDWPRDVGELADHLGIDRFAVLGWSSGGPYAAAVAHEIPDRITVCAIVAGEAPYASDDLPSTALKEGTFAGSRMNRFFIWSANHGPWLMRVLFRMMRIQVFRDPVGLAQDSGDSEMSEKDMQFFTRSESMASFIEAFRQGARGVTRDFTIERLDWPFELEDIHAPTVLVFHGEEDGGVPSATAEYVSKRISACSEATIYAHEGHSVVYYRYHEIIQAMFKAWE